MPPISSKNSDYRGGNAETLLAQTLVVRSALSLGPRAAGLVAAVKKAVAELDPEALAQAIGDSRLFARLLEIFALIALLLASIGIYGSMSYFVTERTHEIGIRIALGAQRGSILGLVTRLGLKLSCIGVAIRAALALILTRVIAQFLFGVTATDLATFAVVAFGLLGIALLACYIPARRATRVDPMVALRHE